MEKNKIMKINIEENINKNNVEKENEKIYEMKNKKSSTDKKVDKKINLSKTQTPMPMLPPEERIKNFDEVAIGYDAISAKNESLRCLNCVNKPCVAMCPVNIDIPEFINQIYRNDLDKAYSVLYKSNALPSVCGRVCPQEKQCQMACVRGKNGEPVAIGRLERYAADNHNKMKLEIKKSNGCKIAVVGSGPSGLACARELAFLGYSVTIFEALHSPGGVMLYGIPEFRLPKKILEKEIDELINLGVNIQTNTVIGKTISIDNLISNFNYKAVYISTGAGVPKFLGISGESLPGVYSANEFLTRINLMRAYLKEYDTPILKPKNTIVIGGGNVAIDAARCARRLGSEVTVVYRRTELEMPARKEEITHAKEEGVKFIFLSNPIKILAHDGKVNNIKCIKMKYIEDENSKEKKLCEIKGKTFDLATDCVIVAIGTSPNSTIKGNCNEIEFDESGKIKTDSETLRTSKSRVYAGGDIVTGSATVILALKHGKKAAMSIHKDMIALGDVSI